MKSLCRVLIAFAAGFAIIIATIGGLNKLYYGRFVVVEMKDATFQRAMVALQRVGATYDRRYLPVPKAAREEIYKVSPSFALLRPYLDPSEGENPFSSACKQFVQQTCGDIPGGWFMWALRDAVAQAGRSGSPGTAANFYESLAEEVELSCARKQLQCVAWLPPLVPPITATQWHEYPDALSRSLLLMFYVPKPSYSRAASSLDTPDAADAVEFLNRPFSAKPVGSTGPETKARTSIRAVWEAILGGAVLVFRSAIIAGVLGIAVIVIICPRMILTQQFLIALAACVPGFTRAAILALIDISSFPTIYPSRFAPANPLIIESAILFIVLGLRVLDRQFVRRYR